MNDEKRKELWNNLLMVAIMAIVVSWLAFAWTTSTGLTFAGGRSNVEGRWANAEERVRVRHVAVLTTVFAVPLALWAAMMRKRADR